MSIHLLIIDPQNDFCSPDGALFVQGADEDAKRLASFVDKHASTIDDIHVTLDSHNLIDVAHPIFWVNEDGKHPDPFTIIQVEAVEQGFWKTTNPAWEEKGIEYVNNLSENGKFPLCLWPPHCMIGTWGHSVVSELSDALAKWQSIRFKPVDFVAKGTNIFTEHYSAIRADVIDHCDRSTDTNTQLLYSLESADEVIVAGEALSHCVRNTVLDVFDYFEANPKYADIAKKFTLLTDTSSSVTGFENLGDEFIEILRSKGAKVMNSEECLA